jgi:hypothetical protein
MGLARRRVLQLGISLAAATFGGQGIAIASAPTTPPATRHWLPNLGRRIFVPPRGGWSPGRWLVGIDLASADVDETAVVILEQINSEIVHYAVRYAGRLAEFDAAAWPDPIEIRLEKLPPLYGHEDPFGKTTLVNAAPLPTDGRIALAGSAPAAADIAYRVMLRQSSRLEERSLPIRKVWLADYE